MEKKLYFTVIMAMIIGSWSLVQADSTTVRNNTNNTVYVQFNYKKSGHKSTQGSQITVPAGQTATANWEDNLTNVYAATQAIPVNKNGCAGANERKRVRGIFEISLSRANENNIPINTIFIEYNGQNNISGDVVSSYLAGFPRLTGSR